MKNEIFEQLIGVTNPCREYSEINYKSHFDHLRDADEFCAAASLYAEERSELLAHSLHRYQQLIDKATEVLKLDTDFLIKKKICFNFYTDIANLFGLGTQAYTTESETPYIGVSELSLQDIYLLQLILLHEMQHALDFVYFDGFSMGIAERELRARITICNSLSEIQKQFSKLYKNAYIDQAYWYVILYNSPNVTDMVKEQYFELLEKPAKNILAHEEGIVFSPLILRVFGRELFREGVQLRSNTSYRIDSKKGKIIFEETELKTAPPEEAISEMDEFITSDLETSEDDEPLSVKLSRLTGAKVARDNETLTLVKNKMMEWHTYKDEFKVLKKQASVVLTRNAESFSNIALPQDTALSVPKIIKVEAKPYLPGDNSLTLLKNLEIPNVSMNTGGFNEDEIILPTRSGYNNKKAQEKKEAAEEYEEDEIAKNVMSNLSDFVNKKRE
jgi:hypothetical protein